MKSYCVLYNKKKDKKIIKKCRKLASKNYNVHNFIFNHLDDEIVPSYAERIDTLFVSKSGLKDIKYRMEKILFADDKRAPLLESILSGSFDAVGSDMDDGRHRTPKMHRKALDALTKNYNVTKYGTLGYGLSLAADVGITYYGISNHSPYFQEGNPNVLALTDFFQATFGTDMETSILLSFFPVFASRAIPLAAASQLKTKNVVTDGKNTYFYKKPYQGKGLAGLYAFSAAQHIYAVGWNALLLAALGDNTFSPFGPVMNPFGFLFP